MSVNRYLNILGLKPGVTEKEIKSAYRRMAKKYHPDVNPGEDSRQKFIEINEAYNFLMNVGPNPHQETVSYNYNPASVSDFEARRAWARAKAEEMERETRRELGIFLRKANRIVTYFSFFIMVFNIVLLVDMFSDTNAIGIENYSYSPLNKYGAPATSQNEFIVAEWKLDSYTVYEQFTNYFIPEPDSISIYRSLIFKKLIDVEFMKNGESKIMHNPANAYDMIIFKVVMLISSITILIFYFTPYYSANKVTLSIVILFFAVIQTFIFLLN